MKAFNFKISFITLSVLFFLLNAIVFSSCSADDDLISSEQTNYFFSAIVDGQSFESEDAFVSAFTELSDFYIIKGSGEASIDLLLESPVTLGEFTTGEGELLSLSYQEINPISVWGANGADGTGVINITENNADFIKGTFSFTGINFADNTTKEISSGEFKARKL